MLLHVLFCIIPCINSLVPAPVRVLRADTGKSGHNPDHDAEQEM